MAEDSKILFFLQLPKDFFNSRRIKKLRRLPDGDSLVLLYLKIQLSTLSSGGMIELSGLEDDPADEIALEISEDPEKVRRVLDFMLEFGLAENAGENKIFLPYVEIMTASHTKDAERMRKARKSKKEREANAQRTADEQDANVERTFDEQTFDRIKSIEYRTESIEQKSKEKEVNVPTTSLPTVPESICSLSNDNECCTDVQRILDAWNAIEEIPKVQKLSPNSKRGKSLGARIKEYGVEKVLEAIAEIPESSFLMGKAKKQFKITFDWFVLPNNFPKVLEGNYSDRPKKIYAQDDLFYRTGKTLGNRVSRRLGLPEDTEETRQAYAAEMEACARETGADVGTEIKDAVFFSQSDPFWQSRIVDAKSFRLNFRKILADMRRKDS